MKDKKTISFLEMDFTAFILMRIIRGEISPNDYADYYKEIKEQIIGEIIQYVDEAK